MVDRHVFIATPTHSNEVCCEYVRSLVSSVPYFMQNGLAFTQSFMIGNALIHDARNRMVAWFMNQEECTDLLFIDADIGWDPKDAYALATSPHDVIGAAYPQKREDKELYNVAGLKPGPTNIMEVDYIGTGFLKISRKAIKELQKAHPEKKYSDPHGFECYGLFEAPIENGTITGEDAFFCRRWRDLGNKVFMVPDVTLLHVGMKAYEGNFAKLITRVSQEPGEAA